VIDSGVDRSRIAGTAMPGVALEADRAGRLLRLWRDDHDRLGHGTECAQIVTDVAPMVAIIPVRVFLDELETSPRAVAAAIAWAGRAGADVINLSLGCRDRRDWRPLRDACRRAVERGLILVAAEADGAAPSAPACFDGVVRVQAVAAGAGHRLRVGFRNKVDCTVDGAETIAGLSLDTGSRAAAYVSGLIALSLAPEGRVPTSFPADLLNANEFLSFRERGGAVHPAD
jgi:subtilisin family serine protease